MDTAPCEGGSKYVPREYIQAGAVSRTYCVNSFSTVGIGIRCGTVSRPKCARSMDRCGRRSWGEWCFDRKVVARQCLHVRLAVKSVWVSRYVKTADRRDGCSVCAVLVRHCESGRGAFLGGGEDDIIVDFGFGGSQE